MKLKLLFILIPIFALSQTQIGSDINGEAALDYFGTSVSLSSDGSIVAIGASSGNNGNGDDSGNVRVFENQSGSWVQIGTNINGINVDDQFGISVSLSANGNIVAIGAPSNNNGYVSVYQNQSNSWVQLGANINGEAPLDFFGSSVSLSADGSILAVGATGNNGNGNNSGHVRVYQNLSGSWVQIGADIDGEAANDRFGNSLCLSADGSILAIGAVSNSGNGTNAGHVRVFQNQSGNWVQIGSDIDGEGPDNLFGESVSLSADGSILAVGAERNDGNGTNAGHARVYQNQSGNWIQIGTDIDGEAAVDYSGNSVSISSDGSILAVGAPGNDGNGSDSGHARIYQNQSGNWVQIGPDIDGEAAGDFFGINLNISSDGSTLTIGGIFNDGGGFDSGHVRIYDISSLLSTNSFAEDIFNLTYDKEQQQLIVRLNNSSQLKQINIFTINGKQLLSIKENIISTNNISKGIYIVEVISESGKTAKKIIIN